LIISEVWWLWSACRKDDPFALSAVVSSFDSTHRIAEDSRKLSLKQVDVSSASGLLKLSHQTAHAAKKANHILGWISKTIVIQLSEVMAPFCSTLLRPPWEYCVKSGMPQKKREAGILEKA